MRQTAIDEIESILIKKNGKCLFDLNDLKTVDRYKKLQWQCQYNHIWVTTPHCISVGRWCTVCAGKNKTIEDMHRVAAERNGKCLSPKYINAITKLTWQCERGHIWDAIPVSITANNRWCPECAQIRIGDKLRKFTIKDMQILAQKHGGECLSEKYIGTKKKLTWKCINGHVFDAVPSSIRLGTWCMTCSGFLSEKKCRFILQSLTGLIFVKTRTKLEMNLELDMYNEENKLAFEYNGQQHYKFYKRFHKTRKDFEELKERDRFKNKLCKQKGILLETIPFSKNSSDLDLVCFIFDLLQKNNIPMIITKKQIKWENFYSQCTELKDLQNLAISRDGKILSEYYCGMRSKYKWQCHKGHTWMAEGYSVKSGCWCPICVGRIPFTIEDAKNLAKERGGTCLSTEVAKASAKLLWKCNSCGNEWEMVYNTIKRGRGWCPKCAWKTRTATRLRRYELGHYKIGGKRLLNYSSIEQFFKSGKTITEISVILNCSHDGVRRALATLGLHTIRKRVPKTI